MSRPIVISKHAYQRMRERFPQEAKHLEEIVRADVTAAIECGRRSKNPPAFVSGRKPRQGSRFVWTECETRIYVISEKRVNGVHGIIVVTALQASDTNTSERYKLIRLPGRQTQTGPHAPRSVRLPKLKGPL